MHAPFGFHALHARPGCPARAASLLSLATVLTVTSCGPLDMALFPTDDWSTVFPAHVKEIMAPFGPRREPGPTGPSWTILPSRTSALAVYDCSAFCHIVIGSVTCQTTDGREAPCVVRLERESCLIGARAKQGQEDIVRVTCSGSDDESSPAKAAGRLNRQAACTVDVNVPGHSSPIPCPSLILAPMKPTL